MHRFKPYPAWYPRSYWWNCSFLDSQAVRVGCSFCAAGANVTEE
ncbi:MAG: hypothetical protein QOK90_08110 [Nitrososphaeraceae archaeon]|nr:hypothetical protein [Nitrososphaeraceae archaeon]